MQSHNIYLEFKFMSQPETEPNRFTILVQNTVLLYLYIHKKKKALSEKFPD